MEILTLLATIVGAGVAALKPENIVASAIGGIIGNRVDAAFMVGYESVVNTLKKSNNSIDWELQKAIRRSFLLALQSIVVECHQELLGISPQQYRGQPIYSQYRSDLEWLDAKQINLTQELKNLEKVSLYDFTT